MDKANTVFRNVAGLIIGIVVFIASQFIIAFLFELLYKIPFVIHILSYPASPEFYSSLGINCGSVGLAYGACLWIGKTEHSRRFWGAGILMLLACAVGAITVIYNISRFGFREMVWAQISAVILAGFLAHASFKGEE